MNNSKVNKAVSAQSVVRWPFSWRLVTGAAAAPPLQAMARPPL